MPKNKRILFAIMGWGLGHATRCIPIIKSLIKDNHVILASNGISALLLQQEFPTLKYIDYPDYAVKYPKNRIMLLPFITFQLPSIIIKLIKEYNQTQHVVKDEKIDIIISDSRYGTFSKGIPTFFIMHQLRFKLDGIFKTIEFLGEWFNYFMFKKYTEVIIPDVKMIPNLTGDLTHSGKIARHPKLHYLGVFCSVSKLNIKEDIDYLFSVSGPEVQRTLFENIILDQIKNIQGENTGDLEVRDDVFGVPVKSALVHQVMVGQLANKRQGTAKTKTRSEVSGGEAKLRPQKHTGSSRHSTFHQQKIPLSIHHYDIQILHSHLVSTHTTCHSHSFDNTSRGCSSSN